MPKYGHLGSKFSKTNGKFEISTFKKGYIRNFVKNRKFILFSSKRPNLGKCRNLKNEKPAGNPRFHQVWNFGWFCVVLQIWWVVSTGFGSFWLVSGRFDAFQVYVSTSLWHVLGRSGFFWVVLGWIRSPFWLFWFVFARFMWFWVSLGLILCSFGFSWVLFVRFDSFWVSCGLTLGRFGSFWFVLGQFRSPFGFPWLVLGCFGPV